MLDESCGYYCQFLVNVERKETHNFEGNVVGIDLGLNLHSSRQNVVQKEGKTWVSIETDSMG